MICDSVRSILKSIIFLLILCLLPVGVSANVSGISGISDVSSIISSNLNNQEANVSSALDSVRCFMDPVFSIFMTTPEKCKTGNVATSVQKDLKNTQVGKVAGVQINLPATTNGGSLATTTTSSSTIKLPIKLAVVTKTVAQTKTPTSSNLPKNSTIKTSNTSSTSNTILGDYVTRNEFQTSISFLNNLISRLKVAN